MPKEAFQIEVQKALKTELDTEEAARIAGDDALDVRIDAISGGAAKVRIEKSIASQVNFSSSSTAAQEITGLRIFNNEVTKTGEYILRLWLPFDGVQDKSRGFIVRENNGFTNLFLGEPDNTNMNWDGAGFRPCTYVRRIQRNINQGLRIYTRATSNNNDAQHMQPGAFIQLDEV